MSHPRSHVVTFKVTAEELEAIKRGASTEGKSISEYCRACVLRDRFKSQDSDIMRGFAETIFKNLEDYLKFVSPDDERKRLHDLISSPSIAAEITKRGKSKLK
jgi:hypothetical protein